ncbi:MAG TPA: hypothetical protein VGQ84_00790, partial [Gaiellaceae bacterium]|nr:hypothetical protein [Gaiellaceae bacterium]
MIGSSSTHAVSASAARAPAASRGASVGKLPLDFVANRGQWPAQVRFAAQKGPLAARFEQDAVKLYLAKVSVVLRFEGASSSAMLVGEQPRSTRYNFFVGNDPTRWRSNVHGYGRLLYRGLYDGIDVRVREAEAPLEYDMLVAPQADLDQVVIGAGRNSRLSLGRDGALLLRTAAGTLRQAPPVAWEVLPNGDRRPVASRFRLVDRWHYGFAVPARDASLPLVIDPGLDWATFLGGNGDDSIEGMDLARDGTGDIVVAGQTRSPDFPRTGGDLRPVGGTPYVARMNSSGSVLKYVTFFGGSFNHSVMDVALDGSGAPVVVGDTNSLDFPTTPGALDRTPGDGIRGDYDAYVIKFDVNGSIAFGTYLGSSPGTGFDQAWRAGFEPSGSVVVSGITTGADFPTTAGAYDRTLAGRDIFVSRLSPTGSELTYSTFLGGDTSDEVFAMVVDSQGFVDLTGKTSSLAAPAAAFPTTADAFDRTYDGNADAFVARLKLDGAGAADLKYSTFLGGNEYIEAGDAIAVDPSDPTSVTVSGFTRSGDFPTTAGALLRTHFAPVDSSMAFVSRFSFPAAAPGSLVWSTLYGAPGNQSADGVTVDSTGAAIIVGGTAANNPPTSERAYDRIPGGGYGAGFPQAKADGYVARISADGSRILYSTVLGGGEGDDVALHVGVAGTSVVVAGATNSPDFPVTIGAFDGTYAADGMPSGGASPGALAYDGFVAKLTLDAPATGDVTPPAAPQPAGPPNGSAFDLSRTVTFDWTDVADPSGIAAYHLQVSPNLTFTNDFAAELAGWFEPWVPTSLAVRSFLSSNTGTWYWRVQALDGANNLGQWSAVSTINIQSPSPPAAPTLVSPPNGGRFAPGNVTLAWNAAAGAKFYEVQVDTRSDFSNANKIWVQGIAQTQFTVSLTAERTYWWRVRGRNDFAAGAWSAVRSFEIKNGSP